MRFVGPNPEGSLARRQVQAKALAHRRRWVLPGYMEDDQRDDPFIAAASSIGYPSC